MSVSPTYVLTQPSPPRLTGCKDDELKFEQEWHTTHIQSKLSDRFRIHFTPHFSGVKDEVTGEVKGDYKFFNKPFGVSIFW